jgi:hypothetical protein
MRYNGDMMDDGEGTAVDCPNCKKANPDNAKICVYCGALMEDPNSSTKVLPPDAALSENVPKWGTSRFNTRMNLVLTEQNSFNSFAFDADQIVELSIGRSDTVTGIKPDVDLLPYGAVEKGVSRKHALIAQRNGNLSVVDLGSHNGTYLNGQRLIANQARVLRDGDDIRLGHIVLRVTFERMSGSGT